MKENLNEILEMFNSTIWMSEIFKRPKTIFNNALGRIEDCVAQIEILYPVENDSLIHELKSLGFDVKCTGLVIYVVKS